jgi:Holliday junction resolvase RusA-like endonuclease
MKWTEADLVERGLRVSTDPLERAAPLVAPILNLELRSMPVAVEQPGLRVLADFTVEGPPVPWQRVQPRGDGKAFVPKATREFEKRVAAYGRLASGPEPYRGPVALTVTFYLGRAKNCPPGLTWPIHQSCGDISNYLKAVEDGLNSVIWRDDRQVAQVSMRKVFADGYARQPQTHVSVEML